MRQSNGWLRLRYRTVLMLAVLLNIASLGNVSAFDNTFPDPGDTEGNSAVWAYNGETRYVRQTDSTLRIWFPGTSGTVNIINPNFCASNSPDYMETEDGGFGSYANSSNVTRFHFFNANVDADRWGIKYASGAAACDNTKTISFSGLTQRENGYYYVNLNVTYVANANAGYDGGMNAYKLSASAGARIGIRASNAGRGTTQEQTGGSLNFINYFAPFGAPCDLAGPTTATLQLYDIDNAGGSGAQPPGTDVRIRIFNITNNAYVDFHGGVGTTWKPNGDNITSSIDFTARPGRKYRLEVLDVYKNNTIQYGVPYPQIYRLSCAWSLSSQARVDGVAGTINARRSTAHTFNFTVNLSGGGAPNVRVVERWQSGNTGNVYDNPDVDFPPNFNDNYGFTVPAGATPGTNYCMDVWYSPSANDAGSENSNNACIHVVEANMSAILELTPPENDYVEIGDTVTANARVNNTGTSAGNIQYNHEIWYEVGGVTSLADKVFDPGDLDYQGTGWVNRTVGAGNNPIVNTYTRPVTSPPAAATHVCSRIRIQRQAGDTTIITNADDRKCVPIGKSPSFAVPNGGVRTGGSYGSNPCRVTLPTIAAATHDKYEHYFGVLAHGYNRDIVNPHHTYVADSVLSLGDIANVVSMKAGIGTGKDTRLHFARGPGPDMADNAVVGGGLFYGAFADIDGEDGTVNNTYGENPFKTHCLSALFDTTRYPAATDTDPDVSIAAPYALPAPVAGAKAVTLNLCGDTPNKLLTLTGPSGGDLLLDPGQQYIVRITQTGLNCNDNPVYVKLASNIKYRGTATAIDKLPQFVFLAGTSSGSRVSIHVDNSVVRLDGIYANRGVNDNTATFLTCAQRASTAPRWNLVNFSSNDCGNRLQINGAVVLGGRLDPYRAFGHSQAGNTDPAEVFNLRPDTVLSDYARDRSSSQLEVVNQREYAPRF